MLASPLRYPGGKAKLFKFFAQMIKENRLFDTTYCEPYAGGAGLALALLSTGFVSQIRLNDADESIAAFWKAVLDHPSDFCQLIVDTALTIDQWYKQKAIWEDRYNRCLLEVGFATYFLNRTNRSGIIDGAGPIGGYAQTGDWKIDARMNKAQQIKQIQSLAYFKSRISITNNDASEFLHDVLSDDANLCYLDPPYYVKGYKLYRNYYKHDDHCQIADLLKGSPSAKWVVSYDDVAQIRAIYANLTPTCYYLKYSAGNKTAGREVMFFSDVLKVPVCSGYKSPSGNMLSHGRCL